MEVQQSPAPIARWPEGEVYANSIRTRGGAFDPRAVVGAECVPAPIAISRIARDVVWALAGAIFWGHLGGSEISGAMLATSLAASTFGWWMAEQKKVVAVYLGGARVDLGPMDATTATKVTQAVLSVAAASR